VIDVTVLADASPRLVPAAEYGLDAAVSELHSHAITGAMYSVRSARHERANDQALAAAGSHSGVRLYPVATLNPVQYLDWRSELERVLSAGVFAVRLLVEPVSEAFRAMAEAVRGRSPLVVPVSRFGDASAIGTVTADLDTPVVLVGGHYTNLGDCLAAMERWPHLYLDTSKLAQYHGVETVVRSVGAQRLLFGSGAPSRPIQAALNALLTAEIAEADKRGILAGNASRLFGVPMQSFDLPKPTHAQRLIDVHAHIGALGFPTPAWQPHPAIEMRIASSLRAIVDDAEGGNAEALASVNETTRAYVVINPNDLEGSCRAMDAAYKADRAVGAKLHCSYTGQPTASRSCMALMCDVAQRGRPLKVHVDGPGWDDALASLALEYPHWPVIVAHAGPGMPSRESAALVERTSNVYVELSTSFPDLPVARDVVRRVSPERLLFGSDAPLLDPDYVLGIYADARAELGCTTDVARQVFSL
jgi:predicted TIM-barrel fold metal-dependent hydrolase